MHRSLFRPVSSGFGLSHRSKRFSPAGFAASLVVCLFAVVVAALAQEPGNAPEAVTDVNTPVTVTSDGDFFVLSNGYLTATISKKTGDMTSLKVKGLETMGYVSGHHAGYWEQNPNGADRMEAKVTIDPGANGGERAEVSIKGWSDGKNLNATHSKGDPDFPNGVPKQARPTMGSGEDVPAEGETTAAETAGGETTATGVKLPPGVRANRGTYTGARPAGGRGPGLLVDMEIRYTLDRAAKGIYTYAIFSHEPSYAATQIGESRYGMKLNGGVFDWISIDAQRNAPMPNGYDWDKGTDLNMKEARRLTTGVKNGIAEHKYDYCVDQFDAPAFGWSSTKDHVGIYFINPSREYLSSGPDHFELTGHLDDADGGDPTLLDYWRGSHYGGSELRIDAGEDWTKVVGPIFIYVPIGPTPDAMFAEAKQQAKVEEAKWPYAWVNGVDYPKQAERATVRGQLLLRDPQAVGAKLPNLLVGLAYPDSAPAAAAAVPAAAPARPGGGYGGPRTPTPMTWQNDAKHYEFWVRGTPDGSFTIPNVRAGTYELHAIADGVLGEYAKADITIGPGGKVDLGKLVWKPVRYGRQLWQVGIPNRSASEFLNGNDHWHWGEYIEYAKLFPNDVNYTIGKSDFHKDWFIYQVPHDEDLPDPTGKGHGRATPWKVHFTLPRAPAQGQEGVLRLALAGVSARSIGVEVNGKDAGTVEGLVYNATINRDGVEGAWVEKDVRFDASLMHAGANTLTLTVPAGGITSGIAYDVVRLELAPAQPAGAR
jgi:rhamnogalacturonan endolyase